ncbi:hypothetical protein QE152_g23688 [Popillia japonica]|uniref:Uncharacterized protein n=1 Tax=Popillia japonica TaxID=7064 RepID=A0AAW1KDJ3_POPJA
MYQKGDQNATHRSQNVLSVSTRGSRRIEDEEYSNLFGKINRYVSGCVLLRGSYRRFATPPNSYTAVTDPIDLVCGRGGDLSMLEILTESEESKETRQRVVSM